MFAVSWRRFSVLLAVALALVPSAAQEELPQVDGKAILDHIKWLADDDREGRAAGSAGCLAAGDYIADHLKKLGLKPMGDNGTYFQNFPIPRGFDIRPETSLVAERDGKDVTLKYDRDLKPLSLSGPGDVEAEAVFAGYGIAAPEVGYDDYAAVDVKGKVVVVLRHAPGFKNRKSPFANPALVKRYAAFQAKVNTAVGAGAAALVIVNDPTRTRKPKDDEPMHAVGGTPSAIPVFHVSYRAGRRLGKVLGLSFQKEQIRIDKAHTPRSRALEGVTVHVKAALEAKTLAVRNVCALLEAPKPAASGQLSGEGRTAAARPQVARETLVIGAHFDHVGLGAFGSRGGKKGPGSVHNGADDNASGSASLLEMAAYFKARQEMLQRDLLFCWFTAEEMGLLGSKHYVDHPKIPLAQCVAMVNLDMVGRLGRGKLQVGGTGTSPIFPKLINAKNREYRIKTRFNPGGRAPSDNSSFYEKGMPVLFFFTGLHKDYHRPSDDWNKIDRRGIEKVARLAADVCLDLATRDTRPPFTRSDASGLSAGPHLGLSLEQRKDGVYVIYVEPKSPAHRARFKVDDKVEEFEDQPVTSITNFNQIHSTCKEGQRVTIVIRRGPRLMKKTVTLGKN
jgi:hypothetical protein